MRHRSIGRAKCSETGDATFALVSLGGVVSEVEQLIDDYNPELSLGRFGKGLVWGLTAWDVGSRLSDGDWSGAAISATLFVGQSVAVTVGAPYWVIGGLAVTSVTWGIGSVIIEEP